MIKDMMSNSMHSLFICVFLFTQGLCDPFCNTDDSRIDLVGLWICADSWLIEDVPVIEIPNPNGPPLTYWGYVFETPKFYVVSEVKVKQDGVVDVIDGRSPEVVLEYWNDTITEPYRSDLDYWIPLQAHMSGNLVTFDGFDRLSSYWRVRVESTIGEPPIARRFAFFARADLPQMDGIELVVDILQGFDFNQKVASAPTGNTCEKVESPVPRNIVRKYRLEGFYSKYTSAYGVPILSHRVVDKRALQRACYVVRFMLAGRKDIRDHMFNNNGRVTIIGSRQTVPMVPEMRQFYWWTRRAAGGTYHLPVNVGAEENMLCDRADGYSRKQDIFMHEFAHGIHLIAAYTAIPTFNSRLQGAFNSARRRGIWSNTYANTDNREYFAEGVQAYFNQQREGPPGGDGIQNNIDTRAELRLHDYNLYKLVEEIFPCSGTYIPRCSDKDQEKSLKQYLEIDCSGKGGTGTGGTVAPENSCRDDNEYCNQWASTGECQANPEYMLINCRKSCDTCEVATTTESTPSTTGSTTTTSVAPENSCRDDNQYCDEWASTGECQANPEYMLINCKKSCDTCEVTTTTTESTPSTTGSTPSTTESTPSTTESTPSTTEPTTTTTESTNTSQTTPTTTEGSLDCTDNHRHCKVWAQMNECTDNPTYMLVHCRKSCDQCENCSDLDRHCYSWESYCTTNQYVITNCKKTCGTC